jgi:cytosine/adenosine deaminase-related metal-dependent hydrolase
MKSLLITNGHLVTLDDKNRFIENGSIFVEGNHIVDVGTFPADKYKVDRTIDARGSLVMPGLINAHHHLYSTFARGFTPPGPPATNFEENLKSLWWKLEMYDDHRPPRIAFLLGRQSRPGRARIPRRGPERLPQLRSIGPQPAR